MKVKNLVAVCSGVEKLKLYCNGRHLFSIEADRIPKEMLDRDVFLISAIMNEMLVVVGENGDVE